jgi:hypothetical protein
MSRLDGEAELQTRSLKHRSRSTAIALPEFNRQSIRGSLFEAAPSQQIWDLFAGWLLKATLICFINDSQCGGARLCPATSLLDAFGSKTL